MAMSLTPETLAKLVVPKPGKHTTHLPNKLARTNAALIAEMVKAQESKGMRS